MTKSGSTFVALVTICSVFLSQNIVTGLRSEAMAGRPEAMARQAGLRFRLRAGTESGNSLKS
jgi:hypothetical protein